MRGSLFAAVLIVGSSSTLSIAALAGPGDIAFTGYNGDSDDDLAFVVLTPVSPGQVVYFNDNEWNGSAIGAGGAFDSTSEGELAWTAPVGGVAAGTIVQLSNVDNATRSANVGTLSGDLGLGADDEGVYAFLGAAGSPTAFLAAIANEDGASSPLANTGLTAGSTAFILTSDQDIFAYTGLRNNQLTYGAYLSQVMNVANWTIQAGGSGNQDEDGTAPDVPFSNTPFTVPEPATLGLLGLGSLLGLRRRR